MSKPDWQEAKMRTPERGAEGREGGSGVRVSGRLWRWAGAVDCLKVKDREKERGGGQGEGRRGGGHDAACRWTKGIREEQKGAVQAQLVRGRAGQGGGIR